jgi:hypothetical protein
MLKKFVPISTAICLVVIAVLLNVTTPATAGPFGILVIFVGAYLFFIGIITYFIYWVSRVLSHLSIVFIARKPIERLTFKRSYYFSTVISAAPIMLIGLQSVGASSIYGFALVLIFEIIGCLYISKTIA